METIQKREAWNKSKLVGQKPPLKPKEIWASLLRTTLAHDYICSSFRGKFVGQIWGNLSAKPCPSMPIGPLAALVAVFCKPLLMNRKIDMF